MTENYIVKSFTNSVLDTNLTVIKIEDEIWFIAKEVAETLEYSDAPHALRLVKEKYKKLFSYDELQEAFSGSHFGNPKINSNGMYLINKSGLIQLVMSSTKPEAEAFQDWVLEEVIPQILEKGTYSVKQKDSYMIEDPIERAKAWIAEQEAHKAQLALANSKLALKDEQINTLEIDNHNKDILIDGNYRTIKLIADEIEALDIVRYARGTLEGKVRSACKREARVLGKPLQERVTVVGDQERKTYLVPNEVYRLVMDRVKNDKLYLKRMK